MDLHDAAKYGDTARLERALENGVPINAKDVLGRTPLVLAAARGHLDVVRSLIKAGASLDLPDDDIGGTALTHAIEARHKEVALELIKAGADVNASERSSTPLIYAALHGYADVLDALLAAGADPNAPVYPAKTPLMYAAIEDHRGILVALLRAGAKPTYTDAFGNTALSLAEKLGHSDAAEILRNAQSDA